MRAMQGSARSKCSQRKKLAPTKKIEEEKLDLDCRCVRDRGT